MISDDIIEAQLKKTLDKTHFPDLGAKYEGKVRDCYTREGRRIIWSQDRISAFDVVLGTIPFKGQVLNQIAATRRGHRVPGPQPRHLRPDPTVIASTE